MAAGGHLAEEETKGRCEGDSDGPRLADASLLLGSKPCPLLLTGHKPWTPGRWKLGVMRKEVFKYNGAC